MTLSAEADAAMLREHNDRIARLLADAEAACGPVAWPRVESAITALVELYGEGISRMLARARQVARSSGELDELIADDEIVSSLLLLHDLHPVPVEERIAGALARLREEAPRTTALRLVTIEGGVAKLRAAEPNTGGRLPATHDVARSIERVAPELAGIEIEIEDADAPRASGLVPASHLVRGGRK
jgi:hypothetical protein